MRKSKWAATMLLIEFLGFIFLLIQGVEMKTRNTGNLDLKHLTSSTSLKDQGSAAAEALVRILGNRSEEFSIHVKALTIGDGFKISHDDSGKVKVTGTSGVVALYGLYDYLKYHCSCQIVWEGKQIMLPVRLPKVSYQKAVLDRFRYYQNVCTDSYSFVWWDWERWEREIDWMALHGINMPLAFTGQEEIWKRVYRKLGLSDQDISDYISGPAFLAWWRMGNLNKWGGPLPPTFSQGKLSLLHKILERMRKLGMFPVLPAFAGNVPASILKIYPNATLIRHPSWNSFNGSYSTFMLEPVDPLFHTIGKTFIAELIAEVGTNHVYSCDTFNENKPSDNSTKFLRNAASATYSAMKAADPKAVWMMQSWVFTSSFWSKELVKAYLSGVEPGNAIILDLEAERRPQYGRFDNFFGHSFIWCMLQNFGGTMSLYGAFDLVNNGVSTVRKMVSSDNLLGVGSCMEGINQNSVMFEFLHEQSLEPAPNNLTKWVTNFAKQRYGIDSPLLRKAWNVLQRGVHNASDQFVNQGYSILTKRPSLGMAEPIWYNPGDLQFVLEAFVNSSKEYPELGSAELFKHDIVDFTRQFLQTLLSLQYQEVRRSFKAQNYIRFQKYSEAFLQVLADLDKVLRTSENFLLGRWLKEAERWGEGGEEKKLLRFNALNQITLWGPHGEISDYAAKQWAGMVKFYYKPRWELFVSALNASLIQGKPFRSKQFRKNVLTQVEIPFTKTNRTFSTSPDGSSTVEAQRVLMKWGKMFFKLTRRMLRKSNYLTINLPVIKPEAVLIII